METQGTIIKVFEVNTGVSQASGNEWARQSFVLQTPDLKYPKKIMFELFGKERIEKADVHVGDQVNVSFDIDAREYNGRWYNSITAFAVLKMNNFLQAEKVPAQRPTPKPDPRVQDPMMFEDEPTDLTNDPLPF